MGTVIAQDPKGKWVQFVADTHTVEADAIPNFFGDLLTNANDLAQLAIALGIGAGGGLLSRRVTISSAQLLAIHDTPVEIIPAPGAGKFIALISTAWQYKAVTTGYSNLNGSLDLYLSNDLATQMSDVDPGTLVGGTTNGIVQGAAASGNATPGLNATLICTQKSQNPTLGDGSLVIFVDYLIKTAA